MSKFKFGDKVWHDNSLAVVHSLDDELNGIYKVIHQDNSEWVYASENRLTPATNWVKCSERMPELDDVKSPCTEYFVATTSNDGDEVQRAYYIDWSSNERKWVSMNGIPIRAKVTHWMPSYTPAPPTEDTQ